MRAPSALSALAFGLACVVPDVADAQVNARSIVQMIQSSPPGERNPFVAPGTNVLALLAETGSRVIPVRGTPDEIAKIASDHPDWRITWSPPRRPLLDTAATWVRSLDFHAQTEGRGAGVVVGVVDTGIDPIHEDFRLRTGETRIAWLIDYSRPPEGRQPNLEEAFGCDDSGGRRCAIFSAADLDELINNNVMNDEPRDVFGHGTHVASLAASNGLSQFSNPRFIGVAPEATLIIARVTRTAQNSILDSDILHATEFVFERAATLGMPAVVNLSLGSDFGPHDGTSGLERGLAQYVGPDKPGHAVVVAAGNSGSVYINTGTDFPEPLGVHTETHVPRDSPVRIPLLIPKVGSKTVEGTVFVWVAFAPGDRISVGLDDEDGGWVDPLEPGKAATFKREGGLKATIFNGSEGENSPVAPGTNGAAIVLDGKFRSGEVFAVRLSGNGTAKLWAQSEGGIGPASGNLGAVFPKATKQGTVNVPASDPRLVAVGATVNRDSWPTTGPFYASPAEPAEPDSMPFFSSSGPNAAGVMKPDIVAPGVYLIGAMASTADPRDGGGGLFDGQGRCGEVEQCLVVDREHAVTSGTSMAAPLVSGAIALLFERDPTLTQDEAVKLLQAGARRPGGTIPVEQQLGPGALDLVGALDAMGGLASGVVREPDAAQSWLAPSASYVRPDPLASVTVVAQLRDAEGRVAAGFDRSRLELEVHGGIVETPLTRVAAGLWRFAVAGRSGSGGRSMRVTLRYADGVLLERTLPIAVDQFVAEEGVEARGGCSMAPTGQRRAPWAALAALVPWALRRRRRRG